MYVLTCFYTAPRYKLLQPLCTSMYYLRNHGTSRYNCTTFRRSHDAPHSAILKTKAEVPIPPQYPWRTSRYQLNNNGAPPCATLLAVVHLPVPPTKPWRTSLCHLSSRGAPPCTTPCTTQETMAHLL